MNVAEFLPSYPPIPLLEEDDEKLYFNFNELILKKREFYEMKLSDLPEDHPDIAGNLLKHQELIARFLASYTLYDELLIMHQAGTGKTCSAVATVEQNIRQGNFKRAIIVTRAATIYNMYNEIVYVCNPESRYVPQEEEDLTLHPDERKKLQITRMKNNVRKFYSIYTHDQFYKKIANLSENQIKETFNKYIFVIDEVHNISESKTMYDAYHRFLHTCENRKVMLLTGTPMRNDAAEIANVMNLILPLDIQIPREKEFEKRFIDSDNKRYLTEIGKRDLERYFIGRTSYLQNVLLVKKEWIGEKVYPINHLILLKSQMSSFQKEHYIKVYKNDTGFYRKTNQASLFVFPDGSIGNDGFNKYVNSQFKFVQTITNSFSGKTREQKLQMIKVWSCKYETIIRKIIENPSQNVFVFNESIAEGGSILFGLLLRQFGFSQVTGEEKNIISGNRYAVLSDTGLQTNVSKILEVFNNPNNKHGKYIRILIGGRKISEGLTFKNIQQIHVCHPHWNFSVIDQALARGLRAFSHDALGEDVVVKIYLHVAMYNLNPDDWQSNIDLVIYKEAEDKDILIKQIEHLIKLNSFDCTLTYDRNRYATKNALDYSRECDYDRCDYKCSGVDIYPYLIPIDKLDQSTYQLYYLSDKRDQMLTIIKKLFNTHTFIYFDDIFNILFNSYQITITECCKVLSYLIYNNIPIKNRYNQICFLKNYKNKYYLTQSPVHHTDRFDSFYQEYPMSKEIKSLKSIIHETKSQYLPIMIEQMEDLKSDDEFVKRLTKLPKDIQILFIETSLIAEPKTSRIESILNYYKNYIEIQEGNLYITLKQPFRKFNSSTKKWVDTTDVIRRDFDSKYSGIIENNKFSIIDREQKRLKGRVCTTLKPNVLNDIITSLNIPINEKIKKKEDICKLIQQFMIDNDLVEYR
jgi:hypothetical protein